MKKIAFIIIAIAGIFINGYAHARRLAPLKQKQSNIEASGETWKYLDCASIYHRFYGNCTVVLERWIIETELYRAIGVCDTSPNNYFIIDVHESMFINKLDKDSQLCQKTRRYGYE